jgi:hypothetical protein
MAPLDQTTFGAPPHLMLAVHQGFSVRYLLQTDVLLTLLDKGARVTVLTQAESAPLRRHLEALGVTIDCIPAAETARYAAGSRLMAALRFIRHYTHAGYVQTGEDHYLIAVRDTITGKAGLKTRLYYRFLRLAILAARRMRWLRRRLLATEASRFIPDSYRKAMERHRPDMLVTTSLGTFNYDQYAMRAAREAGIPVTTVVLSWDNTTSLGYPGAEADYVIAWTEAMKRELVELNDVPEHRVDIGGVAHWDIYFREDSGFDRDAFKRSLGLDPTKRTILIATKSPAAYVYNPNLAKILADAMRRGELPVDCEILIRVHPLHYRFENGRAVYQPLLDCYRRLAQEYGEIVLNEPDIQADAMDYDMADDELLAIARLLRSTDVLVNIFSTMNIEGAIFDIPLVNVSFEDDELLYDVDVSNRCDIMIDWRATHNQRLLALGGCRTVWSPEELVGAVAAYLDDPSLDAPGRKLIAVQEGGCRRGDAGRYIGSRLHEFAKGEMAKAKAAIYR